MWRCNSCGSTELEALDWIDLQTGEHMSEGIGEYYCRACENNVDVHYEEEKEDTDPNPFGDTSVE